MRAVRVICVLVLMAAAVAVLVCCAGGRLSQPSGGYPEEGISVASDSETVTVSPSEPESERTDEETEPTAAVPAELTDEDIAEFFDGAVFVGDSLTDELRNYCLRSGEFTGAVFFSRSGFSVYNAVTYGMDVLYQGKTFTTEEGIAAAGATKVFFMLGINDMALTGVEKAIENWGIMIDRIQGKCPDTEIYIQSCTPAYNGGKKFSNALIDRYNAALMDFTAERGLHYIDVATPMKGPDGGLLPEYSEDQYVHLSYEACGVWAELLKEYARQQLLDEQSGMAN